MIKLTTRLKGSMHLTNAFNMARDDKLNPQNFCSHCGKSNGNNQLKVNCILQFKDPKPSEESIKAKFTKSDGSEVSEIIHGFKTGDAEANLVALMNRIVNLKDLYEMWEDGKSKKLAQTMSRALDGQVRDDWLELISEVDDWNPCRNGEKETFMQLVKQLGQTTFGPKAYKQQCKVMENGEPKIPESNLCNGTYRAHSNKPDDAVPRH